MTKKERKLYTFNWVQGGFNQVYAESIEGAKADIEKKFGGIFLIPNYDTLRVVHDENAYYDNLPLMD